MKRRLSAAEHYGAVVDDWQGIMGSDFHVGFFHTPTQGLEDATTALIDELAHWGGLESGSRVLDAGCGIGSPARRLSLRYGCEVLGITTNAREIELALAASKQTASRSRLDFQVCSALETGLSSAGFDVVWMLESSHLMADKAALFREMRRLLKADGRLIWCDFILTRPLELADVFSRVHEWEAVEEAFGRVKSETVERYLELLRAAGFSNLQTRDVTRQVQSTPARWRENAAAQLSKAEGSRQRRLRVLIEACTAMEKFFDEGLLGYAFLQAHHG